MISETDYTITCADNGYIVRATTQETETKDGLSSTLYSQETYVFTKWDDVIDWLKNAEKEEQE